MWLIRRGSACLPGANRDLSSGFDVPPTRIPAIQHAINALTPYFHSVLHLWNTTSKSLFGMYKLIDPRVRDSYSGGRWEKVGRSG